MAGSAMATIVTSRTITNCATQGRATGMRRPSPASVTLKQRIWWKHDHPTAATMRLDGGHPALDLVNTIYGQVGEPPEHDVLADPGRPRHVRAARRASATTPSAAGRRWRPRAALRDALDALLRARSSAGEPPPAGPRAARRGRRARRARRAAGARPGRWLDVAGRTTR